VIRRTLSVIGLIILTVLILTTRCANYQDVFVRGKIYFTDADCYARMTRVRMCSEHPGLIVRHHDFENFPAGTTPHTTAPLDYLILGLSIALKPFTAESLDLAGALVSPLLGLIGGWFLWRWCMNFRYRWVTLILYAISPILVHGTELGRPDHQSLLILLVTIAICAEWHLQAKAGAVSNHGVTRWSIVIGIVWGFAIWTSAYESVVLFVVVLLASTVKNPGTSFASSRRTGWTCFAVVIALALLFEHRIPSLSILSPNALFRNWASTIGELAHISPANPIWFRWCGYLLLVLPFLIWLRLIRGRRTRDESTPLFVLALLIATYLLTIWQARWAYFFVLVFALVLPNLLEVIKSRLAVWIAFFLSILPILRDWDETFWPNEIRQADRIAQRNEVIQLRDIALNLHSSAKQPFLAPWWLSPEIAYWSNEPGVAGSSHESLSGIEASARFFLSGDWGSARKLLENRQVAWIIAYDSVRTGQNSAAILSMPVPDHPACMILDKIPSAAPPFLVLSAQNGVAKLYRVIAR
jgi:hypothetical protein